MSNRRFALVAGGGTGGHLVPALTVARALAAEHGPGSVELVGSRRGLDSALLAEEGIPATLLPGRGLSRSLSVRSVLRNVGALAALLAAGAMALTLVARRRPSVVVSIGGYASVPVSVAAWMLRVPVVLVNVDAVPGAANRLVGRFARAAAVAFPGTPLKRAEVTGAPVRPEIVAAANPTTEDRAISRKVLGLPPERTVVAAVGGSLGAKRINESVLDLARLWSEREDLALYHVVGARDFPWVAAQSPQTHGLTYVQIEYERRMADFLRSADIVVCRAGANTVAELAVVGVASILVPLPGAPGDHQTANAKALSDAGAAVLLADAECSGTRLAEEIEALVPARLPAMAQAASRLGRPQAVEAVAALVDRCAGRSSVEGS